MKSVLHFIRNYFFALCVFITTQSMPSLTFAQTSADATIDAERTNCSKNSAYTWDSARNRCIQRADAQAARHEVEDCSKLTDVNQRAECHKRIAEQKTGLNSDVGSLNTTGGTNKSMVMNSINDAYAILGFINNFGSKKTQSDCMSKKIFGVTALAGTVSDFYLKARARAKVKELTDKYKVDVKDGAHDAQVKAFQYLKDEQNTVADIANMEKKRNMLLMLGYGAAAVMALAEAFSIAGQSNCLKQEPDKEQTCSENPAQDKCKPAEVDCAKTPDDPKCSKPAAEQDCTANPDQEKCGSSVTFCPGGQQVKTPEECPKTPPATKCEDGSDGPTCPPKPTPATPAEPKKEPVAPSTPVEEKKVPDAEIKSTERVVNGKQTAYYKTTIDGKTYDIVDNKVYPQGSNKQFGTLSYSSGSITNMSGTQVAQITKVSGANTSWIPDGNLAQVHNKMSPKLGK